MTRPHPLGAVPVDSARARFTVWAPRARRVDVVLEGGTGLAQALEPLSRGYHSGVVEGAGPGARYRLRLDGGDALPDPASRSQPEGVHGPSEVVDAKAFRWSDETWRGVPLGELAIYELHVGTFTPQGTFDAAIGRLGELRELGVSAIELMPVAQFPGARNWGYDGVLPFAVQDSYGGPEGLRRLVDACHARGLAVLLDVVYNHLGPEGNVLPRFGPYFTDLYATPWGEALNFDGPWSGEVRRYFVENALHWLEEHHLDGLRLDAVHAIFDRSATPFLEELAGACHRRADELGRRFHVIAESDRNDPRDVLPPELGGRGFDAVWSDDFHHALHALLTGERSGYYRDFGRLEDLARAWRDGFAIAGTWSEHRRRPHGRSSRSIPAERFVVCAQNHDQVGNRANGERLCALVPFETLKLAAGAVLLSPYLPLLFMGEEHGEPAPFLYFTSHEDADLIEAVRRGRREEFAAFDWAGEVPDPQAQATFERSRPSFELARSGPHRALWELYRVLLRLRREHPALRGGKEEQDVSILGDGRVLAVRRRGGGAQACALLRFAPEPAALDCPLPPGRWRRLVDTSEERWGGPGSFSPEKLESAGSARIELGPWSFALFEGPPAEGTA